jgi:amidase
MSNELWRLGAADLAEAIRNRRCSSREALEALLARIDATNPRVHAITTVLADDARRAADAADAALAAGQATGPLHGVPISVKVNVDVAGTPTTMGIPAFADNVAGSDAPVVANARRAGAIPFARTNMPELGLRWHSASGLHGTTSNPWDATCTAGGSSGGEAAALATGMSPLGIGNDVGGSVRYPSQCCGTAALRPTQGRFAHHSATQPMETPIGFTMMLTDGPMARHVRDLSLALSAMGGESVLDPWSVSPQTRPLPPKLRVAVTADPAGMGCDADVAAGVENAASALRDAGCSVEYAEPPSLMEAHELWGILLAAETRTTIVPFAGSMLGTDALYVIDRILESYPQVDLAGYVEALARRTRIAREWAAMFERYDVLVGPVSCHRPFRVGDDICGGGMERILRGMRFVTPANLLGLPVVVVPVGQSGALPLAVQIYSRRFGDEIALAAAALIEQRAGVPTPIDPR